MEESSVSNPRPPPGINPGPEPSLLPIEGLEGRDPDEVEGRDPDETEGLSREDAEDDATSSPSNMDVFISDALVLERGIITVSSIT